MVSPALVAYLSCFVSAQAEHRPIPRAAGRSAVTVRRAKGKGSRDSVDGLALFRCLPRRSENGADGHQQHAGDGDRVDLFAQQRNGEQGGEAGYQRQHQ